MLWHLFLVHDDYGRRVGQSLGFSAADLRSLALLAGQLLTDENEKRLRSLGDNHDTIDSAGWVTWTGSVPNHQAAAQDVLGGKRAMAAAK